MQSFKERLMSFSNWPASDRVSPERLALSGFYYLGRNDEVRCAYCKVEIMKWQHGDDPLNDHKKWAPQCKFAQNATLMNASMEEDIEDDDDDGEDEFGAVCAVIKPVHEQYDSYNKRLATYDKWPRDLAQTPHDLASAGFFYTGRGTEVRCFQSDCGLFDWDPTDNPWREHARWFPRCEYVIQAKGIHFVQESITNACVIKDLNNSNSDKMRGVNKTDMDIDDDAKDERLCKICYDNPRNVCFVPCGHVMSCHQCSLNIATCPLCRHKFTRTQQLFYA